MRMFIALPIPPDVRRALSRARSALQAVADGGRYVPEDNFHITMHFIGESGDLRGAAEACNEAVRGIRPMLLRLNRYGRFARDNSYTAYIDLDGDIPELIRLHESLIAALMDRGFPLAGGRRRLTPHITLARALTPKAPDTFGELSIERAADTAFTANKLYLYESRFIQGGVSYAPLHKVSF